MVFAMSWASRVSVDTSFTRLVAHTYRFLRVCHVMLAPRLVVFGRHCRRHAFSLSFR